MPAVKGKSKRSTGSRKKKGARGRNKSMSFMERVRYTLSEIGSGIVSITVVGLVAVTLLTVIMLMAGGYFNNLDQRFHELTSKVAKSAGFSVSRVTLIGSDHLANRDLMVALSDDIRGSVLGRSLFHVDTNGARERLEEMGWIEAAAVQRLWPNTLHVTVVERRPEALWLSSQGEYFLIDRSGKVITHAEATSHTNMPVLAGTDDPDASIALLKALAERPDMRARVAVMKSVGDRRFDLRFRNDFTARLPEGDPAQALDRLEGLGAGTGKLAETLDYIDLRDPQWAYLKPKTEETE